MLSPVWPFVLVSFLAGNVAYKRPLHSPSGPCSDPSMTLNSFSWGGGETLKETERQSAAMPSPGRLCERLDGLWYSPELFTNCLSAGPMVSFAMAYHEM